MKPSRKHTGPIAAVLAFLAAYGFFQFAYPYHLMRREQMDLFMYDWDSIRQTYRGAGFLARLASDFADQFFHLPAVGPILVALALTAIGAVTYRICRHFLGQWPSLAIATLLYAWSFLRETENLFCTRYTLATLGYLALILLALQFRKAWLKPVAAVLLLAFGVWSLGAPWQKYYGKLWGWPILSYDKVIGLDTEVSRENWDKVIRLSEKDLHMMEASYCYNLAHAMKGDLGEALFNHTQNRSNGLLFLIATNRSVFSNGLAGEAWFHLGNMTVAEQSAIIALQATPRHTGSRYIVRLARANLISGDLGSAQKYLGMLSKTLFYGKWARQILDSLQHGNTPEWVLQGRSRLARTDYIYNTNQFRPVLLALLEANPDNGLARDYLLCYELLNYDLENFMADYAGRMTDRRIYREAVLVWLGIHNQISEENAARYGISRDLLDKMDKFFRTPTRYKNTYWYYYLQATSKE